MGKRKTQKEFIESSIEKHGNNYIYDKCIFIDMQTKVKIICRIHGEFMQKPSYHLNSKGYPECGKASSIKSRTCAFKIFKKEAQNIHGLKYKYIEGSYTTKNSHMRVSCKKHGIFEQTPQNHLRGQGCPICGIESMVQKQSSTTEEFIEKAKRIHGTKFGYSNVDYKNWKTPVIIECFDHGPFLSIPNNHLRGAECLECGRIRTALKITLTNEEYIEKTPLVHKSVYDYSPTQYVNAKTPINILCSKHGVFTQMPYDHLSGNGCQQCSKTGIDKNKPITFYIHVICSIDNSHLSGPNFVGYGISNNPTQRKSKHIKNLNKNGYRIKCSYSATLSNGQDAIHLENFIKHNFKSKHFNSCIPGFMHEAIDYKYKSSFIHFVARYLYHHKLAKLKLHLRLKGKNYVFI